MSSIVWWWLQLIILLISLQIHNCNCGNVLTSHRYSHLNYPLTWPCYKNSFYLQHNHYKSFINDGYIFIHFTTWCNYVMVISIFLFQNSSPFIFVLFAFKLSNSEHRISAVQFWTWMFSEDLKIVFNAF